MIFLQDAYQARLEKVTSQAASTSGSQQPDVAHKIQLWREVSGGVTRGRCYGIADLSANVRQHAPTLTQASSAPSQGSRSGASADTRAARAEQEAVRAWEAAARAEQEAAKARQDAARVSQQLEAILARLTRVEQAPPSAPPPPPSAPGPSTRGDDDYDNEFDPNFSMLYTDDPFFH